MATHAAIIFGQSNATDLVGLIAGVTNFPGLGDAYPAVRLIKHIAPSTSGLPAWVDYDGDLAPTAGGKFGVELSLGRYLDANLADDIVIGMMAISGSGVAAHWDPDGTYPVGQDNLFTQFVAFVLDVISLTGATKITFVHVAGEQDATVIDEYNSYGTNLAALRSRLLAELAPTLGASNLRFVLNRLHITAPAGGLYVRAGQKQLVDSTLRTAWIDVDDIAKRDAAHFDDNGYSTVGTRFGEEIVDLITNAASEVAVTPPVYITAGVFKEGLGAISPTWPVHAAGDIGLLLCHTWGGEAAVLGVPAGFAAVTDSPQESLAAGTQCRLTAYWCRATSDAMTAPTINAPGVGGAENIAQILLFRGCATSGNPWNVTAGDNSGAVAVTAVSIPGDTTTADDCLIVAACGVGPDLQSTAEFSGWANADLTGVVEIIDLVRAMGTGGGFGVATGEKLTAGTVGATTATAVTSSGQTYLMIAFRPPDVLASGRRDVFPVARPWAYPETFGNGV